MLRNKLAEYAHKAWSGWMKYMFGKGHYNADSSLTIPRSLVERWTRQMNTSYDDLSEDEKKSDLKEADEMINILDCVETEMNKFSNELFSKGEKYFNDLKT